MPLLLIQKALLDGHDLVCRVNSHMQLFIIAIPLSFRNKLEGDAKRIEVGGDGLEPGAPSNQTASVG